MSVSLFHSRIKAAITVPGTAAWRSIFCLFPKCSDGYETKRRTFQPNSRKLRFFMDWLRDRLSLLHKQTVKGDIGRYKSAKGAEMLVFWEQRLVILATPKTGSTAIEAALESLAAVSIQRPATLKHTSVADFHRYMGPYLQSAAGAPFTVVALMRQPRDWLGSWFRYRQRDDIPEQDKITSDMSFDSFVTAWCSDTPPDYAAIGSQAQFLCPSNGKRADRVFRYEAIEDFIEFLEARLDFQILLPRLNVSPSAPMNLSPRTDALLAQKAADDFRLYDSLV